MNQCQCHFLKFFFWSGIVVMATQVTNTLGTVRGKGLRPTLLPQSPLQVWLRSNISSIGRDLLTPGTTQGGSMKNCPTTEQLATVLFTPLG